MATFEVSENSNSWTYLTAAALLLGLNQGQGAKLRHPLAVGRLSAPLDKVASGAPSVYFAYASAAYFICRIFGRFKDRRPSCDIRLQPASCPRRLMKRGVADKRPGVPGSRFSFLPPISVGGFHVSSGDSCISDRGWPRVFFGVVSSPMGAHQRGLGCAATPPSASEPCRSGGRRHQAGGLVVWSSSPSR